MAKTAKAAKAKLRFPDELYVVIEDDGDGEETYFAASGSAADLAWSDQERPVGVYVLQREAKVVNTGEVQ